MDTTNVLDVFDPWNLDEILDEADTKLLRSLCLDDSEQKDQE